MKKKNKYPYILEYTLTIFWLLAGLGLTVVNASYGAIWVCSGFLIGKIANLEK